MMSALVFPRQLRLRTKSRLPSMHGTSPASAWAGSLWSHSPCGSHLKENGLSGSVVGRNTTDYDLNPKEVPVSEESMKLSLKGQVVIYLCGQIGRVILPVCRVNRDWGNPSSQNKSPGRCHVQPLAQALFLNLPPALGLSLCRGYTLYRVERGGVPTTIRPPGVRPWYPLPGVSLRSWSLAPAPCRAGLVACAVDQCCAADRTVLCWGWPLQYFRLAPDRLSAGFAPGKFPDSACGLFTESCIIGDWMHRLCYQ